MNSEVVGLAVQTNVITKHVALKQDQMSKKKSVFVVVKHQNATEKFIV